MTCTSPETDCPGKARPATHHSRNGGPAPRGSGTTSARPLAHGDTGTLAAFGVQLELVHEPPRARQSQAEAARGRETVLHGHRGVGDAGPDVLGHDRHAAPAVLLHDRDGDFTARGVLDDVAGDL